MTFRLTQQFKEFPADTIVALIGKQGSLAQIKIQGKSYIVPSKFVRLVKLPPPIPEPVKPTNYTRLSNIKTAQEALRVVSLSCYCGANVQHVEYGIKWIDEKNALDKVINDCQICNERLQQVKQ